MPPNGSRGMALALGLLESALVPVGAAGADAEPATAEIEAARALFTQAEADEDADRWSDALSKLRRVRVTKDTAGVRYHVALCEEHMGALVQAHTDYAAAEAAAHLEQARDVLRLVGKKLADLDGRIAHVTLVVAADASEVSLTLDQRPVTAGAPLAVDPGPHVVAVVPTDGRPASETPFTIDEGETKSVWVEPSPPSARPARESAKPLVAPLPAPPRSAAPSSRPWLTAAWLETAGAVGLAAGGVAAYVAAGAAHDEAMRSCARVTAPSPAACDAYRVPVRAWDWTALGGWAGAAATATWATITWTRGAPGRMLIGAGSVRVEGAF
jgi:hypothetical protein